MKLIIEIDEKIYDEFMKENAYEVIYNGNWVAKAIAHGTPVEVVAKDAYEQGYIDGWKERYGEPDGRPKGEWVYDTNHSITIDMYKCSICGCDGHTHFNYCPNCGADMRGNKKETTFDDYLKEQLKDPEFRKEWENCLMRICRKGA